MSKKLSIIIAVLLVLTGIVAALHLGSQKDVACMVILCDDKEISVSFEELRQDAFSGELIDGKGAVTFHEYTGILLRTLLETKGIALTGASKLTVTSADNFSAEFTAEEILQTDNVYLAVTADGKPIEGIDPETEGVQAIVFGDPNSRRCVRFAQKISIK